MFINVNNILRGMRVLFVFYNIGTGINFHGSIPILSALAKKEGHETKLLHFNNEVIPDDPGIYLPFVKSFNLFTFLLGSSRHSHQLILNIKMLLEFQIF